jgi:hypothetical protein
MLKFLEGKANGRKELLFAVACCRRARELSDDPRHLDAIEAAEQMASGEISPVEFGLRLRPVVRLWAELPETKDESGRIPSQYMTAATRHLDGSGNAKYAANFAASGLAALRAGEDEEARSIVYREERAHQAELIRDIFGLPFQPFRFDPAWLAGDGMEGVELARTIEQHERFEDLPRLAEALERAGCRDRDLLDHCRGQGPHVRGCWVVDALLGREPAVHEGLLTEEDWQEYPHVDSLLEFLRDKGDSRRWRLFAVACCRRIELLIVDARSKRAVEVAARHAAGRATDEELSEAREVAREAEREARRAAYDAEAEEKFRLTARYARFSRDQFAAQAARGVVCINPLSSDDASGSREAKRWKPSLVWAATAVKWSILATEADDLETLEKVGDDWWINSPIFTEHGKMSSGPPPRPEVQQAAANAARDEIQAQAAILRDCFGDFLGPPGEEWEWLASGPVGPGKKWWCRLPTPRRVEIRPEWREVQGAVGRMVREIDVEGAYESLPLLADALEKDGCEDSAILEHLREGGPHVRGCWVMEYLTGRAGA